MYHNGKIYFHSAKSGHKVDAIAKNPKVSFAVVDKGKEISNCKNALIVAIEFIREKVNSSNI